MVLGLNPRNLTGNGSRIKSSTTCMKYNEWDEDEITNGPWTISDKGLI